jgi:hypothetical protein
MKEKTEKKIEGIKEDHGDTGMVVCLKDLFDKNSLIPFKIH